MLKQAPLEQTDDIRIADIRKLDPPADILAELPRTTRATRTVSESRHAIHEILNHRDDRLVVVIGPCSIHDPEAALDYAGRLAALRQRHRDELEIVMRVYFEKPRSTVGWKGLINDPHLDGSFAISDGLRMARRTLLEINDLDLPAGCEFLDMTVPQYITDLVAWAAIGARTTESQIHREMASGLSCPVGFKNGTGGDVKIAVDAVVSAMQPHHFLAVTKDGDAAVARTTGNDDAHIILRGGKAPNFDVASVDAACQMMEASGVQPAVVIDASHANSGKDPARQTAVVDDVAGQIAGGEPCIVGVMVESHLLGGRQDHIVGQPLTYGQSITDGCLDWDRSVRLVDGLATAVARRRAAAA